MVRSSVVQNGLLKWGCHFSLPQKLCSAHICIKPCNAACFLPLSIISSKTLHNRELCIIGHCCRWHPDGLTAGMESSPVIGAGVIPTGSFLKTRLGTLCPFETVDFYIGLSESRRSLISALTRCRRSDLLIADIQSGGADEACFG